MIVDSMKITTYLLICSVWREKLFRLFEIYKTIDLFFDLSKLLINY